MLLLPRLSSTTTRLLQQLFKRIWKYSVKYSPLASVVLMGTFGNTVASTESIVIEPGVTSTKISKSGPLTWPKHNNYVLELQQGCQQMITEKFTH